MAKRTDITRAPKPISSRQIIAWGIVLLFSWFIWSRFAEIEKLVDTLKSGRPLWIGLSLLVQFVYFLLFSAVYWSAFRAVNVKQPFKTLVYLTFAATFVNTTVTSGGAAGTALYIETIRRRGGSPARAMAGTVLVLAADYSGFALLLTVGLIRLIRLHDLTRLEGITSLVMYSITIGVFIVLSAGLWAPGALQRILTSIQSGINFLGKSFRHPTLLSPDWAAKNTNDFVSAAKAIRERPIGVLQSISIAFLAHLADFATLYILFFAFQQTISISSAIIIFVMTILFTVISPTPSGVGIVETVMPPIYATLNIPLEVGTIINLAFRGISFYFPLLIGFFAMRQLRSPNLNPKRSKVV